MRHLFLAVCAMFLSSRVNAESRFDFATTPGKLTKDVRPTEYSIRIAPNLQKLDFTGSETIRVQVKKPVTKLVLNALEMEVASASLDGRPLPDKAIVLDKAEQTLTLNLPYELSTGDHELVLAFSGKINAQGQGLFYASYQEHVTNEKKVMTPIFLMNDQILQQNDKTTFGGADGKEEVDHPDDRAIAAQHENPSTIWLLENEAQSAKLFLLIRAEIALFAEQFAEQA